MRTTAIILQITPLVSQVFFLAYLLYYNGWDDRFVFPRGASQFIHHVQSRRR
jgi:hypothetical protein